MPTINKTSKLRPWEGPQRKAFERSKRHDNAVLYNSREWRTHSTSFRRDNPLCVKCLDEGLAIDSQVTDHIVQIIKGGSIWDSSNLQALCKPCHDKKSREESSLYNKRR